MCTAVRSITVVDSNMTHLKRAVPYTYTCTAVRHGRQLYRKIPLALLLLSRIYYDINTNSIPAVYRQIYIVVPWYSL